MSPAPSWTHPHERFRSNDDTTSKSLTPQRKHRKLLKDGSGIEVWPECVEKIFVEGLRKYWESPYATSQSRGRSRWRNQFLVDYLKSNGVERTKKQVASHIQVLRNMWKGEQEFYLVAGGEDAYSEQTHTTVKAEEQGDQLCFRYPDFDDAESSSNGTSPNFSPPEVKTEFPPSPGIQLRAFPSDGHASFYNQVPDGLSVSPTAPSMTSMTSPSTQRSYPTNLDAPQQTACMTHYEYSTPSDLTAHRGATPSQTTSHHSISQPPKLKALKLNTLGASPSWVRLDTLTTLGQFAPLTPLTLKIKLTMSHANISSTVNDITASLYFSSWVYSAKCLTKVFINGQLEAAEDAPMTLTNSGDGYVTSALPESRLNQCRWLDPSLSVVVTQEIIANGHVSLFIVYVLDRAAGTNPTSANLLNFWKFHQSDKAAAAQLSMLPPLSDHLSVGALNAHTPSVHGNPVSFMYVPTPQCNRYTLPTSTTC